MADVAQLGVDVNTSTVAAAIVTLDDLRSTALSTEVAVTALGDTSVDAAADIKRLHDESDKAGTALLRERREVDNLRMSLDPAYAATQRLAQQQALLSSALSNGSIDAREHAAMLALLKNEAVQTASGINTLAANVNRLDAVNRGSAGGMRNFALQMNQVGQVAMITGNPLQALIVQLPDLATGLNPVAMGLSVAAAMAAQFGYNALMAAGDAEEAKKATDAFGASLNAIEGYASIARQTVGDLREEFGTYADEVLADARMMLQMTSSAIGGQATSASGPLRSMFSEAEAAQERYLEGLRAMNSGGGVGEIPPAMMRSVQQLGFEFNAAANAVGMTIEEFETFQTTLAGVSNLAGQELPVVLERLTELRDQIVTTFEAEGVPTDLQPFLDDLNNHINSLRGAVADTSVVIQNQGVEALSGLGTAAGDAGTWILQAATNVGILNDSQLTGVWSGFDGLIDRARAFLGLTTDIGASLNSTGPGGIGPGQFGGGPVAGGVTPDAVVSGLMARGLAQHIAQGFAANFKVESNFDPSNTTGDGGNAWGLAQWNSRREELLAFAESQGKAWHDFNLQLDFVMHELNNGEAGAWNKIQGARNAEDAAGLISLYYERPGTPHLDARRAAAREYESMGIGSGQGTVGNEFTGPTPPTRGIDGAVLPEFQGSRPPVRPFELGYQGPPEFSGPNPRSRPAMLDENHLAEIARLGKEARDTYDQLAASVDPLIDKQQQLASAQLAVTAAIEAGHIAPEEGARVMALLNEQFDAEKVEQTEAMREAVEQLVSQYDPAADMAMQLAEAQRAVNEAVQAGIYTQQEGAVILQNFARHLQATSEEGVANAEFQKAATEELKAMWQEFGNTVGQVFADIIVRGEDWRSALSNLFANIAGDLIQSGISDLIMSAFGGGFQGSGSIGDSIMTAFSGAGGHGLTSWAGGGYTGNAPRSGGLDGQGGFLAMLHPQEDVYDRAAGQGGGGGGTLIQVEVVGARGNAEIEQMVQSGVSQALARQNKAMPDRVNSIGRDRRVR